MIKVILWALSPLLVPVLLLVLVLGTLALAALVLILLKILLAGIWVTMKKRIQKKKQQR